jgi:acyl-coenzyme A synthetase/AMP-(fatty) acid ligase
MQGLLSSLGTLTDLKTGTQFSPDFIHQQIEFFFQDFGKSLSIKNTDRVILKHGNSAKFFFQLFALWKLGATVIPLSPQITAAELQEVINIAHASVIIDENNAHRLAVYENDKNRSNDEALILFSSGSTASPKGIVISNRALNNKIQTLRKYIPLIEIKNTLCMLPTSFGHGLIANCLFPLLSGCHLFINSPMNLSSARQLRELIRLNQINFFSTVPSFWPLILSGTDSEPVPSLKRIHCASAPLPGTLIKDMLDWAPNADFYDVFGTTETLSWVGANKLSRETRDTRIKEFWNCKASISSIDVNIEFIYNEVNLKGELTLETSDIFSYYLGQSPQISQSSFKTGDLVTKTEEGHFILEGRLNAIINVAGLKVSPEEIDRALLSYPNIQEACSFGIPDQASGERVASAIVLKDKNEKTHTDDIINFLSKILSSNKIPSRLIVVDQIPKNERGKISRRHVKETFLGKLN